MSEAGGPQTYGSRPLHNIRNQLSIILGFCDLLLDELSEQDRKRSDILEMRKAANAALALLEEMRGTT